MAALIPTGKPVASAISSYYITGKISQIVHATGGEFIVNFKCIDDNKFTDIWLRGPAELVFEGVLEI